VLMDWALLRHLTLLKYLGLTRTIIYMYLNTTITSFVKYLEPFLFIQTIQAHFLQAILPIFQSQAHRVCRVAVPAIYLVYSLLGFQVLLQLLSPRENHLSNQQLVLQINHFPNQLCFLPVVLARSQYLYQRSFLAINHIQILQYNLSPNRHVNQVGHLQDNQVTYQVNNHRPCLHAYHIRSPH